MYHENLILRRGKDMINLQTFRKIKELKEQGVNVSKILEECKISKSQYYKWEMLDEETFMRHI